MLKKILIGLTAVFCSCSNNDKKSNSTETFSNDKKTETFPVKELVIDNGDDEGWGADIRLSIISKSENDTSKVFVITSTFKGQKIGFTLSIPKAKEGDKGFSKGIILKSNGLESDNLISTLADLYKQSKKDSLKFIETISVTYVNLDELAKSLGSKDDKNYKTENQYKLFFEGNNEEYAELYLNINQAENWVELREKDEEYRPVILKLLTK